MQSLVDQDKAAVRRGFNFVVMILCLAAFFMFSGSLKSQTSLCSQKTIDHLEDESGEIRSWSQLADFYRRYRSCQVEDASVEEGYSDSVARLLANHWETLPQASRLFARDPEFEKFAFAGINVTNSLDDVNKIEKLAENRCPTRLNALCVKIRNAIREARKG